MKKHKLIILGLIAIMVASCQNQVASTPAAREVVKSAYVAKTYSNSVVEYKCVRNEGLDSSMAENIGAYLGRTVTERYADVTPRLEYANGTIEWNANIAHRSTKSTAKPEKQELMLEMRDFLISIGFPVEEIDLSKIYMNYCVVTNSKGERKYYDICLCYFHELDGIRVDPDAYLIDLCYNNGIFNRGKIRRSVFVATGVIRTPESINGKLAEKVATLAAAGRIIPAEAEEHRCLQLTNGVLVPGVVLSDLEKRLVNIISSAD